MADKHDEQLLGFSNLNKIFPIVDVVDNLNSDITNRPLSAKQGKTLKEMINGITSFNYEIVTELPAVGQKGVIYLILNSASTEENNIYDEYLYVNDKYEKLGSFTTQIDLSQIKDELFYNFDINNALNRNIEDGSIGTVKDEYYNKLLEAVNNNKIITIGEIVTNTIKHNTDETGKSFTIEINYYLNDFGTIVLIIKNDKTFIQKDKGDVHYLNVDSNYQSTWENINEIQQNQDKPIYIKFANGICSPSLYTHVALHNYGKVYDFIYADNNGYLWRLGVVNPDNDTDKIQFNNSQLINDTDTYRIYFEDIAGDTITEENYNNILNAITSHKRLIIENNGGTSTYNCYGIIDASLTKVGFTLHINTDMYRNKEFIIIVNKDKKIYHYFDCIYINIDENNTSDSIFQQCINTDFSIDIYVSYKLAIYTITKVITNTVGENLVLDLISNNIKFKATVTQDTKTQWEVTYLSATDTELGDVLLGYKANANNYPLQVDTEHRAYVNIPEKKYELDINPFAQKPKGTITVEKYNEIYAAIKDGKSIYTQGLLSNAFDTGSGVAIYMNIIYIKGWLIIDNTGAYYIVPDSIDLEYNHYGYFETQYLYIFEDEDLLKLVNNIVIHNYGDKEVVIEITDYEKKGNTITFKLCKNRNYYYLCSFTIGDNNLDITGGEFFYASNLNPGVIGINYEQNGQNYPVKVDELGNAFVNVPSGGRYDLDVSFLSNGFRGTISTDKYNELANAIKDANENNIPIYMSGILVNCAVDDSSITILINSIGELDGALLINNIGEYIFIPKNIELTPGRYKFTTQFAYIFEYQNYLNSLVHNIYIIDNKDNKHTVVSIKDYNKTSDSISFKLVLSNLFYHKCSIDLTNKNRNELDNYESAYIFPTENGDDAGIIKLGYTQNDKNYPLQINEYGQAFVNVPWSGSTYNNATQTSDGLMSKEDKTKLDGLTGVATKILSQSEYDSLTNKDENTVYFIKG
nr:MAG TPA: hypothetical protein [Crassvirales sp.]